MQTVHHKNKNERFLTLSENFRTRFETLLMVFRRPAEVL
jgi:hypothetical protein